MTKTDQAVRMLKSDVPDSQIIAALGVSFGFLSKVRHDTGLVPLTRAELAKVSRLAANGKNDRQIAKAMNLKYEDSPAIAAAKADVMAKTKDLAKALHKEDATSYVPRFTKQLIDMGV